MPGSDIIGATGAGALAGSVIPGIGTAIGAAAGAVVGSISALFGGLSAADRKRQETEEAVRRMKLRQEQYLGTATARAAASGVEFDSSSIQTYLTGMADEFRRESEWALKNGMQQASDITTGAFLSAGAGLAQAGFGFAASQNWFQSPSLDGSVFSTGTPPKFGEFNLKSPDIAGLKWP